MKAWILCLAIVASSFPAPAEGPEKSNQLQWQPWSQDVFIRAHSEHRFVLLDLEAVWCHWCHVMDANTYSNPAVIRILQSNYIVVKVDQDSRPDLSNRYEDYGWPATVVFGSDGQEIVKRRGYLPPAEMVSMLRAIVHDPTPGPSVQPEEKLEPSSAALLNAAARKHLTANFLAGYDPKYGSWGFNQKLLDWDSVEYAMLLARRDNDAHAKLMAQKTLAGQLHLLDPAWGGVYQYSTDGDWNHPHFEKIMQMQAENLRIYALAYACWRDPAYLHAAQEIRRYLTTFLGSPEGAFYTSQDADLIEGKHSAGYFGLNDAQRRRLGIPRVDKHVYARENGWAITGIVALYAATGEAELLEDALRATCWVLANRALPDGGFRHDDHDAAGPYLGDTIAMARAFLALYGATGERQWLQRAEEAMQFVAFNFRDPQGLGFVTSRTTTDQGYQPHAQRDENVAVARVANLLFRYTAQPSFREMAQQAMRFLVADPIVERLPAASALLADFELSQEPLHLTIVGAKDAPAAKALFQAALAYPSSYKRLEWWDRKDGALPNPDVQFPELQTPAAFVCTNTTCSSPIFKPEDLPRRVDRLLTASTQAR
jgi:uncharacterized protein